MIEGFTHLLWENGEIWKILRSAHITSHAHLHKKYRSRSLRAELNNSHRKKTGSRENTQRPIVWHASHRTVFASIVPRIKARREKGTFGQWKHFQRFTPLFLHGEPTELSLGSVRENDRQCSTRTDRPFKIHLKSTPVRDLHGERCIGWEREDLGNSCLAFATIKLADELMTEQKTSIERNMRQINWLLIAVCEKSTRTKMTCEWIGASCFVMQSRWDKGGNPFLINLAEQLTHCFATKSRWRRLKSLTQVLS